MQVAAIRTKSGGFQVTKFDMTENGAPAAAQRVPDRLVSTRRRMVEQQIRARGVRHPDVLSAMRTVPRHRFAPSHLPSTGAYEDRALPIGPQQTVSQPFVVAKMTELVIEDSGLRGRVLEIGTGSGYQAAVLAELFGEVVTIEHDQELAIVTRRRLHELAYRNIDVRIGQGRDGVPDKAPYDAILVTAGLSRVPEPLLEQLTPGTGRLVAPIGRDSDNLQLRIVRAPSRPGGAVRHEDVLPVRFVPLV